jgi:DNA-binding transcriptional LysR family regulator
MNAKLPPHPRISLEQWRALVAVVDCGGYAQAAAALNKSQSAVTYAMQKLEASLEVKVFQIRGRKAALTDAGQLLYRRAHLLLEEAGGIERAAHTLAAGWEAEIALAVEVLFPTWLLLRCLDLFGRESPLTRIELFETVLDGTPEALRTGAVDLAISPVIPDGFTGESLLPVRFVAAAHPQHPLHALGRELTMRDLRKHRHLVVRDTGSRRDQRTSVESAQRWTVTNMTTSIGAACRGYGYAWFPEDKIRDELASGVLKTLPLRGGSERMAPLYLVVADADGAGPGTRRLAQIIREQVSADCAVAGARA